MNLLAYELFASVARTQNISKTAKEYFISQPAVSHHIKVLEQSLGAELMKRTKRGITLTTAGKEYLPYIQEILSINERADNHIRNIARGVTGHISIAALSSASAQVSDSLVGLYKTYPNIQVDVDLFEGHEISEALRKNTHDFYFAVAPMLPDNMGYDRKTISVGNLLLYTSRTMASSIDINNWDTIAAHPFVSVPKADTSLYEKVMTICKNRGFQPRIVNIYNRAEAVVLAVNAGLGVAILPESLENMYHRDNVVTFPIKGGDARAETVFIWSPGNLTPAGGMFRDIVLSMSSDSEEK